MEYPCFALGFFVFPLLSKSSAMSRRRENGHGGVAPLTI
jgi:hypothetical protein